MNKKTKLFLKTIDIVKNEKLLNTISLFVENRKNLVLYKNGQLFFIQKKAILNTKEVDTKSRLIVEFDGVKMRRIDRGYYLGSSVSLAQKYDYNSGVIDLDIIGLTQNYNSDGSSSSGGSSNNNNNNNNNNNGNNNNG